MGLLQKAWDYMMTDIRPEDRENCEKLSHLTGRKWYPAHDDSDFPAGGLFYCTKTNSGQESQVLKDLVLKHLNISGEAHSKIFYFRAQPIQTTFETDLRDRIAAIPSIPEEKLAPNS